MCKSSMSKNRFGDRRGCRRHTNSSMWVSRAWTPNFPLTLFSLTPQVRIGLSQPLWTVSRLMMILKLLPKKLKILPSEWPSTLFFFPLPSTPLFSPQLPSSSPFFLLLRDMKVPGSVFLLGLPYIITIGVAAALGSKPVCRGGFEWRVPCHKFTP